VEPILLVDDESAVLTGQGNLLTLNGFSEIREARTLDEARAILAKEEIALVILDLSLDGEAGQELLEEIATRYPTTASIVVTGTADIATAVECMRSGAWDFLVKGTDSNRLPSSVRNTLDLRRARYENRLLREAFTRGKPSHPEAFEGFLTRDPMVLRTFVYLEALAPLTDPILITGETGVGKELIARGIHRASGRTGEFLAINLGGLDDHVFSDTVFGHRKGAYTGADSFRDGLITAAAEGTLFLDEIGEMPPESQARLLRLLDSGEFFRLGSDRPEYSKARIVCATNRDLESEVQAGRFRRDLYFRIATHQVRIPPLRERPGDIPLIMERLMANHAERIGRTPLRITDAVVRTVGSLPLEGNVRELQQIVLRALFNQRWDESNDGFYESESPEADTYDTEEFVEGCIESGEYGTDEPVVFGDDLPTPDDAVRRLLEEADRRYPGSRAAAAAAIGLSPQAFANRWKRMVDEESRES